MKKLGKIIPNFFDLNKFPIAVLEKTDHPNYPAHLHSFTEIQIILSGSATNMVDSHPFDARSGDVFIFYGPHYHAMKNTERLHVLNVLFDPTQIPLPSFIVKADTDFAFLLSPHRRWFKLRTVPILRLGQDALARIEILAYQLRHEIREKNPGYELFSLAYLIELLALLSRAYAPKLEARTEHLTAIKKATEYIDNHYTEEIDLNKVAAFSGLSRSRFYKIFRTIYGETPGRYITQLRNRKAAYLLKTTQLSITEIAFQVGFNDSNYFSRCFYKIFKTSPRAFRLAPMADPKNLLS